MLGYNDQMIDVRKQNQNFDLCQTKIKNITFNHLQVHFITRLWGKCILYTLFKIKCTLVWWVNTSVSLEVFRIWSRNAVFRDSTSRLA
jgi:hypothetical protein